MLVDSGITAADLIEVAAYLFGIPLQAPETDYAPVIQQLEEQTASPAYLLRLYEQTLVNWYKQAGIDVDYDKWSLGGTNLEIGN